MPLYLAALAVRATLGLVVPAIAHPRGVCDQLGSRSAALCDLLRSAVRQDRPGAPRLTVPRLRNGRELRRRPGLRPLRRRHGAHRRGGWPDSRAGLARAASRRVQRRDAELLVVLPLVLALPAAFDLTPLVVVTQALVELVAMVVFVRLVSKVVSSTRGTASGSAASVSQTSP